MTDNLPPLSALRVFEAAARHLNFTRAAEELGMTQAAVSYQIKLLEERIGAPLFLRRPKQLALTFAGKRLAPGVIEAFEIMRSTVVATRERARTLLSITAVQTFASNWLVHRLGRFQLRHPDIAVKLDISPALVDFAREPFDVGFRSGLGHWPGLDAQMIVRADFTPMMAPALAKQVRKPADLLKLNLLDPDDAWWSIWFSAAGLTDRPAPTGPELKLNSQSLLGSAAIGGNGVAVLTPAFFATELANGQLVQPFALVCTRGHGYFLVYPHARRNAPHIRAFRDWILSEAPETAPVADGTIAVPMQAQ